jgi:hypothetical protein
MVFGFFSATKARFWLSYKERHMKIAAVILPVIVCMLSCGKNNISEPELLKGKWELRVSSGGIAGTIVYKPGNGVILNFYDNWGYKFAIPGMPLRTGIYELKKTTRPGDWILLIHYTTAGLPQLENDSIRVEVNKLIFLPPEACCDIPEVTYERVP